MDLLCLEPLCFTSLIIFAKSVIYVQHCVLVILVTSFLFFCGNCETLFRVSAHMAWWCRTALGVYEWRQPEPDNNRFVIKSRRVCWPAVIESAKRKSRWRHRRCPSVGFVASFVGISSTCELADTHRLPSRLPRLLHRPKCWSIGIADCRMKLDKSHSITFHGFVRQHRGPLAKIHNLWTPYNWNSPEPNFAKRGCEDSLLYCSYTSCLSCPRIPSSFRAAAARSWRSLNLHSKNGRFELPFFFGGGGDFYVVPPLTDNSAKKTSFGVDLVKIRPAVAEDSRQKKKHRTATQI